jgi:hypothetical protein
MGPLKNTRHERFAQNVVSGLIKSRCCLCCGGVQEGWCQRKRWPFDAR